MAFYLITSCSKFDDSKIWDKLNDHEYRIAYLEEVCRKMNTDIVNLQTIVTTLEANDYITNASPLQDGSGYTLIFKSGKSIVVNHGKDGINGTNGTNGKDGTTPTISVMKDVDDIYYWTINEDWLLIDGEKVRASAIDGSNGKDGVNGANGIDGITPQFKIEDNYWHISYDNGTYWEKLGKAIGNNGIDGTDGDSMFKIVYIENGYVCFELNDNTSTIIKVPLMKDGILCVTVETEGALSKTLTSEQTRTTTMLSINGRINADDMRYVQIMNNLQKLDLSNATYVGGYKYGFFELNPCQDTLVNKSIEEVVLPKIVETHNVDLSYCLALKKVTVTNNYVYFSALHPIDEYACSMRYCYNTNVVEYAEGVVSCSGNVEWETIESIEKIVYPSTMEKIPCSITINDYAEEISVAGYAYAQAYTVPCKTVVCKAITPPVLDTSTYSSGITLYYDDANDGYYYLSSLNKAKRLNKVVLPEGAILYVPRESIELYKTAPLWKIYTDIRAIEDMK